MVKVFSLLAPSGQHQPTDIKRYISTARPPSMTEGEGRDQRRAECREFPEFPMIFETPARISQRLTKSRFVQLCDHA
jgi:hypothetical protein